MKILVVEDEVQVSSFIRQGLEEKEFDVEVAHDGVQGDDMARHRHYDVVVVDILIPGMSGLDLCRGLKKDIPNLPILLLTTLGTTQDKVAGFDAGADDYLLKPFEFEELTARLKALARRPSIARQSANLQYDDLTLDLDKKLATRDGKTIRLSAKEFALLEYFLRHPDRVVSRTELAEKIWNITFDTGTNVVEVYMNMLRNKIDRDFPSKLLHTRIGLGYVLSREP